MNTNTLPVADAAIDADPTVAELEQRIVDGDTSVTATMLEKARAAAAGRTRFEQLRGVAGDRAAAQRAEEIEHGQAEAAERHAREVMGAWSPATLVDAYDRAVDGLRDLAAVVDARNAAVLALLRLPAAERLRGAVYDPAMTVRPALPLDGVEHTTQGVGEVLAQVLGAARIVRSGPRLLRVVGGDEHVHVDDADPALIAESRTQLDAQTRGGAA